jgi:signal transduction histidine kinase
MFQPSLQFLDGGGDMGARMRAFDWQQTPLGPPANWPQSLKTIVRVMLDSRFAMWMAWGAEGTFFCNDAYLPTVGIKRDWVLGARADAVWAEIWHDIGPRIDRVLATGTATWDDGLQLFLARSGYLEETFHTFSYSPVYDDANRIAGMLCVVVEDTERAIGERRLRLLRELAALTTAHAGTLDAAAVQLIDCFEQGRQDAAFAALYLQADRGGALDLVGQTRNVPGDALPRSVALPHAAPQAEVEPQARPESDTDSLSPAIAQCERSGVPAHIDDVAGHLGDVPDAWNEPVQQACVLPLRSAGQSRGLGVLVVGISTRRQFDDAYQSFLALVASQVASRLAETRARLDERRKADALAELDQAKNIFFSNVSHELRTPLTLMLGPLGDMLNRDDLPSDLHELLRLMHRNGQRLRRLVNSLLEFSRIEAGRVEASFHATDLAALTRDLASSFRSAVEHAGLRFVVQCEPLPAPVFVDVEMWEKVVLNLLSNAFKFTFDGEIRVALSVVGQHAELTVSDTGIGMDADALAHLFDRFHRVAGARSRSHEGTGIGLALVKELVRLHGGSVIVHSQPGQGSRFVVTLPLGTAHLPPERVSIGPAPAVRAATLEGVIDGLLESDPLFAMPATPSATPPAAATQAATVLVVDDNADMRAYVARVLGARWQVQTAANGLLALALMAQRRPDLIVSDVMMPALDGWGLLQRVRENEQTRSLPFVLLSAQAGEEARLDGLARGADDYIVKPFSARELVARVEVLLVREQMHALRDTANRAKDEFLAMLGHELRNPLAPIRNALQLMRLQWRDAAVKERDIIERQVHYMVRLVDDLLDVARITRGRIELECDGVDLGQVIAQAVETVNPLFEQKRQSLQVDVQGPLPLWGDAVRLGQIVANLLTNANKFSDAGCAVRMKARRDGHEALLTVADEGIGMSADELDVVFEAFVQGKRQALHRPHGGLGLGLAIARNLAQQHGGSLHAHSDGLGRGSRFSLRLPLRSAAEDDTSGHAPMAPPAHRSPVARRVLIVDDNQDAADTLATLLQTLGHEPLVAHDGPSALQVLAQPPDQQPIHVAVLDIGLPGMDGYELARRIRATHAGSALRLIALTGYGQEDDRLKAATHGFDQHLVKPVDVDALLALVVADDEGFAAHPAALNSLARQTG